MKDFIGKTFGRLSVLSYSHSVKYSSGYSRAIWNCQCSCGNLVKVRSDNLTRGRTKSCGCLLEEYNKSPREYRTPEGQTSFIKLYSNYKHSAKKRRIEFALSKDEFKSLISQDCTYCGSPPSSFYLMRGSNGGILYNGIDRVKSSLGYTLDNVVPCCGMCNRAKIDMDVEEFMLWINRLVNKSVSEEKVVYFADRITP